MSTGRGRGRPPGPGRGKPPAAAPTAGPSTPVAANGTPAPPRPMPSRTPSATQSLLPSRQSSALPVSGVPRMRFRPNIPPRRVVKADPDAPQPSSATARSESPATPPASMRPRAPRPPKQPITMTASGPLGRGTGAASRRDHSQSVFSGPSANASSMLRPGVKTERDDGRSSYREPDKAGKKEREEYSDTEENGYQIIDMEDVSVLDEMAPQSLPRVRKRDPSAARKQQRDKQKATPTTDSSSSREASMLAGEEEAEARDKSAKKDAESRNADALDLSASENEEVMDDLAEDFLGNNDGFDDGNPEDRLYLFQFPPLFPHFVAPPAPPPEVEMDTTEDGSHDSATTPIKVRRSVAFADDTVGGGGVAGAASVTPKSVLKVKSEGTPKHKARSSSSGSDPITLDDAPDAKPVAEPRVEGQIGRLDVFRDGRVNFRFGDGLVMEVTGGSQASFLQQVMIIDGQAGRATTMGELHRKFVVAPEIASMLADADLAADEGDARTDVDGIA